MARKMINVCGTTFETEKFYLFNTTEIFYFILKNTPNKILYMFSI